MTRISLSRAQKRLIQNFHQLETSKNEDITVQEFSTRLSNMSWKALYECIGLKSKTEILKHPPPSLEEWQSFTNTESLIGKKKVRYLKAILKENLTPRKPLSNFIENLQEKDRETFFKIVKAHIKYSSTNKCRISAQWSKIRDDIKKKNTSFEPYTDIDIKNYILLKKTELRLDKKEYLLDTTNSPKVNCTRKRKRTSNKTTESQKNKLKKTAEKNLAIKRKPKKLKKMHIKSKQSSNLQSTLPGLFHNRKSSACGNKKSHKNATPNPDSSHQKSTPGTLLFVDQRIHGCQILPELKPYLPHHSSLSSDDSNIFDDPLYSDAESVLCSGVYSDSESILCSDVDSEPDWDHMFLDIDKKN